MKISKRKITEFKAVKARYKKNIKLYDAHITNKHLNSLVKDYFYFKTHSPIDYCPILPLKVSSEELRSGIKYWLSGI